jgi:hypothetical protein
MQTPTGSSEYTLDKFDKCINFFINRKKKSSSVPNALPKITINNSHNPVLTLLDHMSTANSVTVVDLNLPLVILLQAPSARIIILRNQ